MMDRELGLEDNYSYDVFLNFAPDTRRGFTGHLYAALNYAGIKTFTWTDEVSEGLDISHAVLNAIRSSRIAIVVLSPDYGRSALCLRELAEIVTCREVNGQMIFPVYYDVDKSDTREWVSMLRDMNRYDEEQLEMWRYALREAVNLRGFTLNLSSTEAHLIKEIVISVRYRLNNRLIAATPDLVEIKSHQAVIISLLNPSEQNMVGICGMGGTGKTTIAKAIYELLLKEFEHNCLLPNVRETCLHSPLTGLLQLQSGLLSQVLGENITISDVYHGIEIIKRRICSKRTLLVIDDVSQLKQLQALAGSHDWFGQGSVIIITTRDRRLLEHHQVKIYEVPLLGHNSAYQLFTKNFFHDNRESEDYKELANAVVNHAQSLPLAITVLGAFFSDISKSEWTGTLEALTRSPHRVILERLRPSYDSLGDEEKNIFLDIACFFKGQPANYVKKILGGCYLSPDSALGVLEKKFLISIRHEKVDMHDMIQKMGWEIVRLESPDNPCKHSRLWDQNDICKVFQDDTGTEKIQGIKLELVEPKVVRFNANAFKRMRHLRLFIAHNAQPEPSVNPIEFPEGLKWLEWPEYPFPSLPLHNHQEGKLLGLYMRKSHVRLSEGDLKPFVNLKFINFSYCTSLINIPDVSSLSNLECLDAEECKDLIEVHQSLGELTKLVHLNFLNCHNLHIFPVSLHSDALQELILEGCAKLTKFPEILVKI